jgi:high-affinity iron transporter
MPEICSPAVSPAVVYLTPVGSNGKPLRKSPATEQLVAGQASNAKVVLVNQQRLQFTPRVQAIAIGQTVRFTNLDSEAHVVHIVTPGFEYNQAAGPGQPLEYTPQKPGVLRLACDIHLHMRGYVVVSPTPWVQVCTPEGKFRLEGVADGHYLLTAWHEMGPPMSTPIRLSGGASLELPEIVLAGPADTLQAARGRPVQAPIRPWPEVLDRISVTLAACRDAAAQLEQSAKARRLAEDAYWVEFEGSDLETAVRKYLGYARAGEIEGQFRTIRQVVREVAAKRHSPARLADLSQKLLLDLVAVVQMLNAKGVTDRSRVDSPGISETAAARGQAPATAGRLPASASEAAASGLPGGTSAALLALKLGLRRVGDEAEHHGADAAASELTTVYMTEFEPLERSLYAIVPQDVRALEIQFNALRGELQAGLKGESLASRLDDLASDVESLIARVESRPSGTFSAAFVASFITILREGLEVILVLAMLFALVARAASPSPHGALLRAPAANGDRNGRANDRRGGDGSTPGQEPASEAKTRALASIWWGTGLAALASIATAIVLSALVAGAKGAAREALEGVVMLLAAGMLFYVSHWLLSQVETKRWLEFLKERARRGLELSGRGTLALTAFLAVYREGAETALLYQALAGSEGRTRPGLVGLVMGLVLGLALLSIIAVAIRATTIRLPVRPFFKFSSLFLFALSVIFAGNGVFELQNSGVLRTTNVDWMGRGIPWLGVYPTVQVLSVQLLLLTGAVALWLMIPRSTGSGSASPGAGAPSKVAAMAENKRMAQGGAVSMSPLSTGGDSGAINYASPSPSPSQAAGVGA